MSKFGNHFEKIVKISAKPKEIFDFADNHENLSTHMKSLSWMMGGGKMDTQTDTGNGQKVGSHIRMSGNVLGFKLGLDEVVTIYDPPTRKEWQTVGGINLIVIGHYKLGFEVLPGNGDSKLKIYIDYDLPQTAGGRILGYLLGDLYAKWCVSNMTTVVRNHFV